MAIESKFVIRKLGEVETQRKEKSITSGSCGIFPNLDSKNRVVAALDHSEKRGTVLLGKLKNVYAIKYYGEEDFEGEIVDLHYGSIEMAPGDEVHIIKHFRRQTKELRFHFEDSNGNADFQVPKQSVSLEQQ